MTSDEEGFAYPSVEKSKCIDCGLCNTVCPVQTEMTASNQGAPVAFAAKNSDEEVRAKSSSGGIFSLLAEEVLKRNGVVFGVAMADNWHSAKHIEVQSMFDLKQLQGSKYIQSNTNEAFQKAEKHLKCGRIVLFTGTPCQIEALNYYLQKEYDNLITQDLICHGVPSPKVWDKYVSFRENRAGAVTRQTFFRDKKYGWKMYSVLFEYSNNTIYEQVFCKDLFMQAFLQNVCLRPSCTNCHFKKINRVSDITLADFWGIQNILPEMDDNKGTSLVLIHSKKGNDIWQSVADKASYQEVMIDSALQGNSAITVSAVASKYRKDFFEHLDTMEFDALVRKYTTRKRPFRSVVAVILRRFGILDTLKDIFTFAHR